MSNKGGRVSPDYLADIAPEYALEHASDTFCNTPFIKDRINLMLNIVTGQLWFPINTNS